MVKSNRMGSSSRRKLKLTESFEFHYCKRFFDSAYIQLNKKTKDKYEVYIEPSGWECDENPEAEQIDFCPFCGDKLEIPWK